MDHDDGVVSMMDASDDEDDKEGDPVSEDELYDERKDDKDEKFAQSKRSSHLTDGTLACPSCFTTVCLECQAHAEYETQFRAISAMNVRIKHDKQLRFEEPGSPPEIYSPVACMVCGFELAVYGPNDEDMFHFFEVICSAPQ